MKKILCFIAAAALLVTSCETSRTSTSNDAAYDLPVAIRSDFQAQYPTASGVTWTQFDIAATPIDWEMSGWAPLDANDYVVTFDMGTDRYYAYYDSDGTWVGTAYTVANHNNLPSAVYGTLNAQYKDYTIERIDRELWGDNTAYEIKLRRSDDDKIKLLIDSNGTVLKQKIKD
jgi:hypothetical protein